VVLELSRERIPDEYEQMFLQAGAKMVMHFFNHDGVSAITKCVHQKKTLLATTLKI
jgi:hypothetical protein